MAKRGYPIVPLRRLPAHSPDSQHIPTVYQGRADNSLQSKMKAPAPVGQGFGALINRTARLPFRALGELPEIGGGI